MPGLTSVNTPQLQQYADTGANMSGSQTPSSPLIDRPQIADHFEEVNIETQHGTYKFKCKTCSNMFRSRHALYEHINTHLGRKPYSCETCGQTFAHHSTLYNHKRNKHTFSSKAEKEAYFKFKCPTCDKKFEYPSALDRHFMKFPEHSALDRIPLSLTASDTTTPLQQTLPVPPHLSPVPIQQYSTGPLVASPVSGMMEVANAADELE